MRPIFSHLNYYALLLAFLFLGFSSCFKKYEEVDNLTTNIFDREYTGKCWYNIESIAYFVNDLGQSKARLGLVIPKENLPKLRPSNITVELSSAGYATTRIDMPITASGDYEKFVDLPYAGVGEYCVTMGIFVAADSSIINSFPQCILLE